MFTSSKITFCSQEDQIVNGTNQTNSSTPFPGNDTYYLIEIMVRVVFPFPYIVIIPGNPKATDVTLGFMTQIAELLTGKLYLYLLIKHGVVFIEPVRRYKREAGERSWRNMPPLPPRGIRSCGTWRTVGITCLIILVTEAVIAVIIILILCCKRG